MRIKKGQYEPKERRAITVLRAKQKNPILISKEGEIKEEKPIKLLYIKNMCTV